MCVHETDHVFTDIDILADGCQPCGNVARKCGTNPGAFQVRARALQGRVCIGQQVLRLVALCPCLVQQGPGSAVLGGQFLGTFELSLAILEFGPESCNGGLRSCDLDPDETGIDAGDDITGINVVTDIRQPGQHPFDLAGDPRVIQTDHGSRHVDRWRHLA